MNRSSRVFAPLFLAVTLFAAIAQFRGPVATHAQAPATANSPVEVLDLGPAPQTGGFASIRMTRDYRNIAITGNSGSRMAAFLNGASGEKYDQVQTIPPVISADGKHMAYAARKSGDLYVVVDGKEYGPYTSLPSYGGSPFGGAQPIPWQETPQRPIVFSPDSKHFAFVAGKKQASNPSPLTVVVEDGKEMPQQGQADTTSSLQFSKHGDHLLWVLLGRPNATTVVVVDGIEGAAYNGIYQPQFSDDGRHLAYTAQRLLPAGGGSQIVEVFDGKEGPVMELVGANAYGNGVLMSPDGAHLAYPAHTKVTTATQNNTVVVIDGKVYPNANRLWMSPDGKTIAYESLPNTGSSNQTRGALVINGKTGTEYTAIMDVRFAPDGHVVYSARAANQKFFVVDGDKELGPYDSVDLTSLSYSADNKHQAFAATGDGRAFAVFDRRKLQSFIGAVQNATPADVPYPFEATVAHAQMFKFTADGHLLYHASTNSGYMKDDEELGTDGLMSPDGRRIAVVKANNQGSSTATAQLTLDGQAGPMFHQITRMVFSPDSTHFAYVGIGNIPSGNGKEGGYVLMVDGVQKGDYPEVADIQFSPDSQHLFHFTTSHIFGGPGRAYMDQKNFFTFMWLPGYFAHWLDDNRTLQILGGKYDAATYRAADDEMYRVRYFLTGANRKQETPAVAGPATVDMTEAKNMVGGGGVGAAVAAAPAPTGGQAPAASGATLATNASAASPAAAGTAANPTSASMAAGGATLPAGTSVEVRMIDPIDANNNTAGKTYRAAVTKTVAAGIVTIPQGAIATVIVTNNGANTTAQLTSITINGQVVPTSSSSATVTNGNNGQVAAAASQAVNSLGGLFGHHASRAAAAANTAAAVGAHIKLPTGTVLTFVLAPAQ